MTLRARLGLGVSICFGVLVVAFVLMVQRQERVMVDQIDGQLEAANRSLRGAADRLSEVILSGERPNFIGTGEAYLGIVTEGRLITLASPASVPDLEPDAAAVRTVPLDVPATVDASDHGNLRVIVSDFESRRIVLGIPIQGVDDAITQLRLMGVGVLAAVALAASIIVVWVHRLGIAPIKTVADVALAITDGSREERVPEFRAATEAATLGTAMNLMLDASEESEARLRQFVADASHELRTPLTTLVGYSELYRAGQLGSAEAVDDAMRRIRGEATRMMTIVDHLFRLAHLDETNDEPVDTEPVDLSAVAADICSDAQAMQPGRTVSCDAQRSVIVGGDRALIHQAVNTFVANALSHTPPDAEIRIGTSIGDECGAVWVEDDGPGIESPHLDRIFDRFYRVKSGRDRGGGGAGLGLSIARSIADAHGGSVSVDSEVGTGTRFTLWIPTTE